MTDSFRHPTRSTEKGVAPDSDRERGPGRQSIFVMASGKGFMALPDQHLLPVGQRILSRDFNKNFLPKCFYGRCFLKDLGQLRY